MGVQRQRLEYLDFCKVLAIFLVTFAHCAQQISGNKFPDLLLSKDSFISINMAVFMVASGFVMNIEKMKTTSTAEYLKDKAIRLLIPMTAWYMVMCIVSWQVPRFTTYWSVYWYLGALFVCLSTIKVLTNYVPNVLVVALLSIIFLSCIPLISFERSCYMIPFLWIGYVLRRIIDRIAISMVIILSCLYVILYNYWDIDYSIYESPFHIWNISSYSVFALLFRLLIGVVGSVAIIVGAKILISYDAIKWMKWTAKYGPYTLVFYTMSFVMNASLARLLWHINVYINTPGILDTIAIVVTAVMIVMMYYSQLLIRKNRWLRLLFMGEK